MPISRRNLLLGGATLAGTSLAHASLRPTLPQRPQVAHIVTAFDVSNSMNGPRRIENMTAWANVMRTSMAGIIRLSGYKQVVFEAFMWAQTVSPLIPRITLYAEECQYDLEQIARILESHAHGRTGESTDMLQAIAYGQTLFNAGAQRQVLNICTDERHNEKKPEPYELLKVMANQLGITQNGMVIGRPSAENGLIPNHVITGSGCFAISTTDYASCELAYYHKFLGDMS